MTKNNDMFDKLYNYIITESEKNGTYPTVREMGAAMGLSSTCTVIYYLKKLEEMGKIKRDSFKKRTMQIVDKPKNKFDKEEFVEIPLVGKITAGEPILAVENLEDTYVFPTNLFHGSDLFMLTVQGESMINAGINDGDLIIVKKQTTAQNGEIVAALIDDSATVKRFYKELHGFRLQPENDTMSPIYVNNVDILGKVVGLIRKI